MSSTEYAVFARPDFDPNEYATAILSGESYEPSDANNKAVTKTRRSSAVEPLAKEDISVAISKLNTGIDDVTRKIKSLVSKHHEELLLQASSAHELSGSLTSVKAGIADLDGSLDKLRTKIRVPYQNLRVNVSRFQKLQQASDVLRRTSRFVVLARRLQIQMAEMESGSAPDGKGSTVDSSLNISSLAQEGDDKERAIAKAALSIAELSALLDGVQDGAISSSPATPTDQAVNSSPEISLRSINAVAAHLQFVEESRTKVTTEMQNMVKTGLATLNQALLASSLQTAYNLRLLPELVQRLLQDLTQAIEDRIRNSFDVSKISKEVLSKDPSAASSQSSTMYKSRVRTEPTPHNAPQYSAALWTRLESLVEDLADCCIKVYTLEKVLKLKKDAVSQVVFLDEAMKLLEAKPSTTFWTSVSQSLERNARDAAKGSGFLQSTLGSGYPKLLRLFQDFFAKIAMHTDTLYTNIAQSPETILILRALSNFEALYLSRSSNKLNEVIGQALQGGARQPPSTIEALNVTRTLANELDSARFDPLLVKAVAKNVAPSLQMLLLRVDTLVVRDRSAVSLVGPTATPSQVTNASVSGFLYQCWVGLQQLQEEYPDAVMVALKREIDDIRTAYDRLMDPVMTAVRREIAAIIAKLHRINLERAVDPMSGMGGASFYIKDLADKLSFLKNELLSLYSLGEANRVWILDIVKFTIKTFVLHVSIAKPLGESGKLQLTSDMTELEFALNAFMVDGNQTGRGGSIESLGQDYRLLRAMRPLLFLENSQLASPTHTAGLPPLVVLHHILVRSPIPLPHSLHGWQEAEYVRWVEEHSEEEAWTLIDSGLAHWEKMAESEGKDPRLAREYIDLAKTVLENTQKAL
ncbi:hypothetical protein AX16_001886 [Volvariella volvacea WC 439]|nr:hypothetical protein AX16_001886 [Volvariella volvacea WC 439]